MQTSAVRFSMARIGQNGNIQAKMKMWTGVVLKNN